MASSKDNKAGESQLNGQDIKTGRNFSGGKFIPYALPLLGWLGLLGKLRILYLVLLTMGSLATSSYVVQNPGVISEAKNSVKQIADKALIQAENAVVDSTKLVILSNTSPSIDPRFSNLDRSLSVLTELLNTMETQINLADLESSEIAEVVNKRSESNSSTNIDTTTTDPASYNGIELRLDDLEAYINNGFDVSKFKVLNEDERVLGYNTSNGNLLEINSNARISGDLSASDNLDINGILTVQSSNDDPGENPDGGLYFNTDTNQLYVGDGDNWNQVGKTYSTMTDKGMHLVNDQFGLIDCANSQIMKYSSGTWVCSNDLLGVSLSAFQSLADVPVSYSGMANRLVRVGVGESSLEFLDASSWDQDNTNDLTSASTFSGSLSGIYNNLQLGTSVIGSSELASTGVTAGIYGGSDSMPVFTVDEDGRITSAFQVALSGGANITSVGTITSGTWHGSLVSVPYGGTGSSSFTTSGIIYGNGTGPLQQVGVGTSGQILVTNSSSQPVWADVNSFAWGLNGNDSTETDIIGTTNTVPLRFGTSSQEVLRVTHDGKIGVGTTNPTEKLHISGGSLQISNPSQPVLIGSTVFGYTGYGLDVVAKVAYIAGDSGVYIYDVSATSPVLRGNISTSAPASSIKVRGKYAYVATTTGGLNIYNVANVASPTLISNLPLSGADYIDISGQYAYIGSGATGLNVVDISDPSTPVLVGNIDTTDANGIYVQNNRAYLADGNSGVKIIDITRPSNPVLVGSTQTSLATNIKAIGRYVYIADGSGGLRILNVVNESGITQTGQYLPVSGNVVDLSVEGKYIYLLLNTGSLEVIDASTVSNPVLIGSVSSVSSNGGINIQGRYAYVVRGSTGLGIIDLTGSDINNLSAGSVKSGSVKVSESVKISNYASIKSGLNVGVEGILSNGAVSIQNSGVTSSYNTPALNVLSGSNNGAKINIQTSSTANNALDVRTAGISRLFVGGNGNVGIGITNPTTFTLEVAGNVGPATVPAYNSISTTTTQISTPSFIGGNPAMKIGRDGQPIIVHVSSSGILTTKCQNSTCTINTTTSQGQNTVGHKYPSIDIGPDGLPVIAYGNDSNGTLVVTKCGNIDCTAVGASTTEFQPVSGDNSYDFTSVAVPKDNLPIIVLKNNTDTDLLIVKCGDSSCITGNSTTQIVSANVIGNYNTVKIGSDGLPIVVTHDFTAGDVIIIKCGNSTCNSGNTTTTLAGDYNPPAMEIPLDGLPFIVSPDRILPVANIIKCLDIRCSSTTANTNSATISNAVSVTIGTDGLPVIFDTGDFGNLHVTKCANSLCTDYNDNSYSTSDNDVMSLFGSVLAQDGLPIVAYEDSTNFRLTVTKCATLDCANTQGSYISGYDLGSLYKFWNQIYAVNYWAKSSISVANFDVAEDYETADTSINSGDIVALSDNKDRAGLVKASNANSSKTIGIVSTKPGLKLTNFSANDTEKVLQRPVALAGRVPVKISSYSPGIKPGDLIMISGEEGKGMKAYGDGFIVGKALESWSANSPKEKIMVFVTLGYHEDQNKILLNELSNSTNNINIDSQTYTSNIDNAPLVFKNGFNLSHALTVEDIDVNASLRILGSINSSEEYLSMQDGKVQIFKNGGIHVAGNLASGGKVSAREYGFDITNAKRLSAGTINIRAGESKAVIMTSLVNKNSKIFLTNKSTNLDIKVVKINEGEGFEVELPESSEVDSEYDWVLINSL